MSYRGSDESDQSSTTHWYWPEFGTLEESYAVARKAYGGWIFAGMIVLGTLVTYFSGKSLIDLKTPETSLLAAMIGEIVELLFVLFAAYQMVTGRGWIISWFLLAIFAGESVTKILAGRSFGWIFFYIGVGASLLAGARACWDIRSRLKSGETMKAEFAN